MLGILTSMLLKVNRSYSARRIAPASMTEAPSKRSFILFSFRKTPAKIIIKSEDNLKIEVA
ncbi:MAG: hypothetical protein A2860_00045 [Candidatus Levybacteria bacterium RIFCSPHIGHO2_01_FULL_37_33]|nr:MAG: hypothetical protein A2860_00045 [Candidatus Levybacteria bacterium RIFCSPHIGHO2_01_FULL_37_33]OGH16970.1 MAG: hypothetical protein A3C97_03685 [Candidatus Levybacteria bacterium RIFCSPHIGHO2_02_FULL_37_11]OGH29203.1 MAG: hypothetical protein A3F30_04375 [Candidatus Levybacteria bacterium RIFCSPHIGHO2_12_FULL_37_12]OGH33196.1 MAG: hypothetical protein A2953_02955 [Candidatus Levybacteria bacterium RIFCSPLOWO2_01_FULL_36_54]